MQEPKVEAETSLKPAKQVSQGPTEEVCLREIKVIEDLIEKLKVAEEGMEKLFAASVEALDRAEGLKKEL